MNDKELNIHEIILTAHRFKMGLMADINLEKEATVAAEHRAALFNMQRVIDKIISNM